jgi:hypothetical protein
MDEQKKDETTGNADVVTNETEVETSQVEVADDASTQIGEVVSEVATTVSAVAETVPATEVASEAVETKTATPSAFNYKVYIGAVLVILAMAAGLIFILEKDGRISTGLFSTVIGKMEASTPVAKVNDVVITKGEFNVSLAQLTQMTAAQGADVKNESVMTELRKQAIDTLVNAELLRQTAIEAGKSVTDEQVETRFTEISDGLGGAEALASRMAEFGVTEESLRRDIENEFLIQALFDEKVDTDSIEVTEEEVVALYAQAGGAEAGLPPMTEIRDQIEAQIRFNKEQVLVNEYITNLKSSANVEVMI